MSISSIREDSENGSKNTPRKPAKATFSEEESSSSFPFVGSPVNKNKTIVEVKENASSESLDSETSKENDKEKENSKKETQNNEENETKNEENKTKSPEKALNEETKESNKENQSKEDVEIKDSKDENKESNAKELKETKEELNEHESKEEVTEEANSSPESKIVKEEAPKTRKLAENEQKKETESIVDSSKSEQTSETTKSEVSSSEKDFSLVSPKRSFHNSSLQIDNREVPQIKITPKQPLSFNNSVIISSRPALKISPISGFEEAMKKSDEKAPKTQRGIPNSFNLGCVISQSMSFIEEDSNSSDCSFEEEEFNMNRSRTRIFPARKTTRSNIDYQNKKSPFFVFYSGNDEICVKTTERDPKPKDFTLRHSQLKTANSSSPKSKRYRYIE